jgi:hypothetical protein
MIMDTDTSKVIVNDIGIFIYTYGTNDYMTNKNVIVSGIDDIVSRENNVPIKVIPETSYSQQIGVTENDALEPKYNILIHYFGPVSIPVHMKCMEILFLFI